MLIDKDSIFKHFEAAYESQEDVFDPFTHPYVLMGLIVAGVRTFDSIARSYSMEFPKEFEKVHMQVKTLYYERLYTFAERIDPFLSIHLYECCKHDRGKTVPAISKMISFFEQIEEYEKCGKLKVLLDTIISY